MIWLSVYYIHAQQHNPQINRRGAGRRLNDGTEKIF